MDSFRTRASIRRPWSIAARLVTLYVVSVTALLVLCFVGLYLSVEKQDQEEDKRDMDDQMILLRRMSSKADPHNKLSLRGPDRESADLVVLHYFLARILDSAGRVIVETPGMAELIPSSAFPKPTGAASASVYWKSGLGKRYLLSSSWSDGNLPRISRDKLLQVALDQTSNEEHLANLRRRLGFVLAGGILFSAALGAWVARRALRPLNAIVELAGSVKASQLGTRVAGAKWPIELGKVAESLDRMLERLEESFDRLTHFSANLSHELRTPINILRGEAEVALSRPRSAEEYREIIESGLEEYHRLGRLIEDLLLLARAESADVTLRTEVLDVGDELRKVLEFYETMAEENGVAMSQAGAAEIRGDSLLFRRMVSNLVANALRHTPRGGSIDLLAGTRADGTVEVEVRDTGEGIPAEHLGRVFDRFYRVERDSAGEAKGFGLGLAIVRSIAALHGGTVEIESSVGKGTHVVLTYPSAGAI